jgi:hypothetical protein
MWLSISLRVQIVEVKATADTGSARKYGASAA